MDSALDTLKLLLYELWKYNEHVNVARDVFNVGFDSCSHTAIIQHSAAITLLPAMIPFTVYCHFVQSLVAFIKMNP